VRIAEARDESPDGSRLPPEAVAEALSSYGAIITEHRDNLEATLKPWSDAQADFTKTITTLASGSLVLSVSVAQLVLPRIARPRAISMLAASWIMLTVVILIATLRTLWLQRTQLYGIRLEALRIDVRTRVRSRPTKPELEAMLPEMIAPQLDVASRDATQHHILLIHSQAAAIIGFAIAMASLVGFAVANLGR
jgi:hypothetical protein